MPAEYRGFRISVRHILQITRHNTFFFINKESFGLKPHFQRFLIDLTVFIWYTLLDFCVLEYCVNICRNTYDRKEIENGIYV